MLDYISSLERLGKDIWQRTIRNNIEWKSIAYEQKRKQYYEIFGFLFRTHALQQCDLYRGFGENSGLNLDGKELDSLLELWKGLNFSVRIVKTIFI